MNTFKTKTLQPKGITMANNWKKKELNNLLILKEDMIANDIDINKINQFMDKKYSEIDAKYQKRIAKYNKKLDDKNETKKNKKQIKNIINNVIILEQNGIDTSYVKNYLNKEIKEIKDKESVEKVNFLD
jgi:Na+/phosphate symporter